MFQLGLNSIPILGRRAFSSTSKNSIVKEYVPSPFPRAPQFSEIETQQYCKLTLKTTDRLLHGSPKAREEAVKSHSAAIGRNKYIHEFQRHKIIPSKVEAYKEKIGNYYKGICDSSEFDVKLTGSFEVVVGEVDSFIHIWEYEGMPGFGSVKQKVKESHGHLETFNKEILPLLDSRSNQLCQEFSFWPSSPPVHLGGIYELRTYQLLPGALLEWESEWIKGVQRRIESGHSPIGAWFSQIGNLHQVHHMWNYASLEDRRQKRAKAWQVEGWAETTVKTVKLTQHMESLILRPLPFSPIS